MQQPQKEANSGSDCFFDHLVYEMLSQMISNHNLKPVTQQSKKGLQNEVEQLGFQLGRKVSDLTACSQDIKRSTWEDLVKYICKNIWTFLFNKQTNHLWKQTENGKLSYVLVDEDFRFLSRLSCDNPDDPEFRDQVRVYEAFILGIIHGVLVNMGLSIQPEVSLQMHSDPKKKPDPQNLSSNGLYKEHLHLTLDFSKLLSQSNIRK